MHTVRLSFRTKIPVLAYEKIPLSLSSFYIGNPNICKHKKIQKKIKKMAHVIARQGKKITKKNKK